MKKIILVLVASVCSFYLWSQGSLQLTTSAFINTTGNAYLVLDNVHLVNNGTLLQTSGNGTLKLTGGLHVDLSGSSATTINHLIMTKSGSSSLNLQSNLSVISNVTFSGGLINLNNNTLDLSSTGSIIGESETSRAFTTGTGYIQASGLLNAPTAVNPGNLGAVITSTANMGNTTIRRGHAVQSAVYGSNNSIRRYYDIIPANNSNLKAKLRFYYFDAELNGIAEPTLHQWKSKDNINWDLVGADISDATANYVEKKSINKFDRWTLATATAPVINCPPNMTVSANQSGCKASVSFAATATAIPAPTISYSIGNKTITSPYVFPRGTTTVTATASNGVLPDATCSFTVTVVCGPVTAADLFTKPQEEIVMDDLSISVRPNPSASHFNLDIRSNDQRPVTIRIIDVLGRVISIQSNVATNTTLSVGHKFVPGVYIVHAIQGKRIVQLKLVKQ